MNVTHWMSPCWICTQGQHPLREPWVPGFPPPSSGTVHVFAFAASFSSCCEFLLLPWRIYICREVFAFAVRYFVFAMRSLVLPRGILFLPWGILFLPWGFWFCCDSCGLPETPLFMYYTQLVDIDFNITRITSWILPGPLLSKQPTCKGRFHQQVCQATWKSFLL